MTKNEPPSPLDSSLPLPEGEAERADTSRTASWPLAILLLLAAGTLLTIQLRRPRPVDPLVGQSLPPLDAAGWLNAEKPLSAADLRGKIVVIDFWASWCAECAIDLSKLVAFHERYRDRGVVLIGLTDEPASELSRIESFLAREEGADWPIGYGAWMAYELTGIEGRPQYVLYDQHGMAVWAGTTVEELEDALVELLARM